MPFVLSSTADHHTLRSISRLGGGAFEYFDIKAKSTWEKKLNRQISRCCQPAVSNIRLEWGDDKSSDGSDNIQAPAQITTVFSGSRLVVYALVNSCSQVVLKAAVPSMPSGSKEVITKFATEDVKKSQGMIIHRLAARAIVQDWEEGALHSDRLHHEVKKMEIQSSIVPLSMEYDIITPFTSFIAVEERQEGEDLTTNTGPTVAELVAKEDVDNLAFLDWQDGIAQIEANPEKHVANLLHTANTATETLSFDAAEKYYEDAHKMAEEKLKPESSLALEVSEGYEKGCGT
ncbi:protein mono-ADP-ribosyltransferase PARP4-like [Amphiura filiformis]|uniref:protein mono-ADP-ribosyltransferase PARP4-like n=1 Tax=Amphiura filiformis TaxID=82378 RepID=UPI003B21EEA3